MSKLHDTNSVLELFISYIEKYHVDYISYTEINILITENNIKIDGIKYILYVI